MSVKLRKARVSDYSNFNNEFLELMKIHEKNLPDIFQAPDGTDFPAEYFERLIDCKEAHFIVAYDGDLFAGFIIAFRQKAADSPMLIPRDYIYIEFIGVNINYRNKGIGHKLLAKVENWAKKQNIQQLELKVWGFNDNAINFYKSIGYGTLNTMLRKIIN
ncbi:hypothetical protein MASR1M45_24110 [Candidatus Kapaibacterium sp.]